MSRSAHSPRFLLPYSPRHPSPLGLPPLAHHTAFQDEPCNSAIPKTPEPSEATGHMRILPEARRPLAGGTQRPTRAPPPAFLTLDTQYHPPTSQPPDSVADGRERSYGQTLQPPATEEMRVPPSPTPSSTSSLSLYSADSAKKSFSIVGVIYDREEEEEEEGGRKGVGGGFFACFSNFTALFSKKSKPKKILAPRELDTPPTSGRQMVQTYR
ncbi:hypothetical protein BYT27DRAFT_7201971 [Phlegmacium glaucopus]|nr:hypothetical protein BYT27DRAFT_7201971 [Phlegmacium glaucopus]